MWFSRNGLYLNHHERNFYWKSMTSASSHCWSMHCLLVDNTLMQNWGAESFSVQRLQTLNIYLGRWIVQDSKCRSICLYRSHIDDVSAPLLEHLPGGKLRQCEHGQDVDIEGVLQSWSGDICIIVACESLGGKHIKCRTIIARHSTRHSWREYLALTLLWSQNNRKWNPD